jgi:hypothetical protein
MLRIRWRLINLGRNQKEKEEEKEWLGRFQFWLAFSGRWGGVFWLKILGGDTEVD